MYWGALPWLLVLAFIVARLFRYQSRPLDWAMKLGMCWIAVQLARLAAAALKG